MELNFIKKYNFEHFFLIDAMNLSTLQKNFEIDFSLKSIVNFSYFLNCSFFIHFYHHLNSLGYF